MADGNGISIWVRMFAGTCGTVLIFLWRIPSFTSVLDPERTDVSNFQVLANSMWFGLPLLGLNIVYMVYKKEREVLHLVLSAVVVPIVLMCILEMIPILGGG